MRLTITKKIAAAVVGIVLLCTGAMVWLSSQNLQRGFIAYLNQVEAQELTELAGIMADAYRRQGSLQSLRHNPDGVRALLNQRSIHQREGGRSRPEGDLDDGRPPPPPRSDDPRRRRRHHRRRSIARAGKTPGTSARACR